MIDYLNIIGNGFAQHFATFNPHESNAHTLRMAL